MTHNSSKHLFFPMWRGAEQGTPPWACSTCLSLSLRLTEQPCSGTSAEKKSKRLNPNHTITFKALAWTDGTCAHILLQPDCGREVYPTHSRRGALSTITTSNEQCFGVYDLADLNFNMQGHVHTHAFTNGMAHIVKLFAKCFWWTPF